MKEVRSVPRERGHAVLKWLKEAVAVFSLAILVTAYTPSGPQSAPAPAGKTSAPAFASPKELPSKGSPGAKLGMVLFTEFH